MGLGRVQIKKNFLDKKTHKIFETNPSFHVK